MWDVVVMAVIVDVADVERPAIGIEGIIVVPFCRFLFKKRAMHTLRTRRHCIVLVGD
jgi:hypothetical protein